MSFDKLIEQLYNLDKAELRRLAWEALLISDGPNKSAKSGPMPTIAVGTVTAENASIFVLREVSKQGAPLYLDADALLRPPAEVHTLSTGHTTGVEMVDQDGAKFLRVSCSRCSWWDDLV